MSKLSSREKKRRLKIKADIVDSILKIPQGGSFYYAIEALKKNSNRRVSNHVIKEIIKSSSIFEKLNPNTGTTRLKGFPIDIEYTLKTTNTLQISNVNIGGRDAMATITPKVLKEVILTYDRYIEILVEANPGQGQWELSISKITQYLNDGTTLELKISSKKHPLIKVVAVNNDRFYSGSLKTEKV